MHVCICVCVFPLFLKLFMYIYLKVYAYGKNNCVSEKEWDQTYQLFVKKSSRKTHACTEGCCSATCEV